MFAEDLLLIWVLENSYMDFLKHLIEFSRLTESNIELFLLHFSLYCMCQLKLSAPEHNLSFDSLSLIRSQIGFDISLTARCRGLAASSEEGVFV